MKLKNIYLTIILILVCTIVSCDDFLHKEPSSSVTPENYYKTEDEIQACANKFYDLLPTHGTLAYGLFGVDMNTDNQAASTKSLSSKFAKGQWKVPQSGGWSWSNIRNINYQLRTIMDRYLNKEITGSDKDIRQYIGEIYFFRAYAYFSLLQNYGDLPIITQAFPDDESILVAAEKRRPCNEVARFIISDLDSARTFMTDGFDVKHTRISSDVALLFKSRVALFEGSWLTNFKGTPFVPNGPGWLGADKDYNKDYQYPTGNIDNEAKYFFKIAASAAENIAEKYKNQLVYNTGLVPQNLSDPENPYFSMFGSTDLSGYPEVLLWRGYNKSLGVTNGLEVNVEQSNSQIGVTRSLIEDFLMSDGKPIYALHDGYEYCDTSIAKVSANRDPRLYIFLKRPGQKNYFKNVDSSLGDHGVEIEPKPNILNNDPSTDIYTTGYALRKGGTFDKAQADIGQSTTAAIIFRASEAFLNYIEAEYMLTKDINSGHILEYWKLIRKVAGFKGEAMNPITTINATDMSKEKLDWGAYSSGQLLSDRILYNIRRERRCELMGEGLRWFDLVRWRSLDQMINTPYHVEGFHLWGTPMEHWYKITSDMHNGSSSAKLSSPDLSSYLRPYEINKSTTNLYKDGLTWSMAQYLSPLSIKEFLLTSSDHVSIEKSPLYQNPYWPTVAGEPAEK